MHPLALSLTAHRESKALVIPMVLHRTGEPTKRFVRGSKRWRDPSSPMRTQSRDPAAATPVGWPSEGIRVTDQRGLGDLPVSGGIADEKQATAPIEMVTSRLRTDSEARGSREDVTSLH